MSLVDGLDGSRSVGVKSTFSCPTRGAERRRGDGGANAERPSRRRGAEAVRLRTAARVVNR